MLQPYFVSNKTCKKAVTNRSMVKDNIVKMTIVLRVLLCLFIITPAQANGIFSAANAEITSDMGIVDPFGRETPRSTVQGFIAALSEDDSALASNYLDLDASHNGIERVRQFKLALDVGGRIKPDLQISNEPSGNLADKLPLNYEKVGTITTDDRVIDLLLIRETSPHGNQYWQFSPETLQAIKQSNISSTPTIVSKYTFSSLKGSSIAGYNLADIVAVLLLAISCIIFTYTVIGLIYLFFKNYYPKVRGKAFPLDAKVILPLALVVTSMILTEVMVYAGVSVTVREPTNRIKDIVGWFALTWLLLRVADAIFNRAERQSYKRNQTERVSILSLLRKLVKVLLLILASIYIFGNLGFDLTTGFAALGVGGLALALGAQKMIENLVGSVVVVADQPVRVGDYCKFGNLEGTVIDIGIRSTRVRTLNRTVVTVPNGDFSSMSIENYASRDMFHFLHNFYIKRDVDVNVLAVFLRKMTDFITNHKLTNSEWNQVRIAETRQDCFVIEMRAYVYATGAQDFYDKQSTLLIAILREMATYPVEQALPMQELVIDSISQIKKSDEALEEKKVWVSNQGY